MLVVLPGAGRNSDDYRNAWIEWAECEGRVVAALGYPETHYDLGGYQLAGLARQLTVSGDVQREPSGVIRVDDSQITVIPEPDADRWLFADFDRVVAFVAARCGNTSQAFDLFGHSAGAQILHRMALARPLPRVRNILAANAGWYTLPDLNARLPYGLGGLGLSEAALRRALAAPLTVLLGGDDNHDAAGGTLLRTPMLDRRGTHRLARGRHFFDFGKRVASVLGCAFRWQKVEVPDVGHDFYRMSQAAAHQLTAPDDASA